MKLAADSTQTFIDGLVRSTEAADPVDAIRTKARELIDLYVATFGEPSMPIPIDVLASLCGISQSQDAPLFSPDAELAPDGAGGIAMRVNPDRPETRQRFSMAHEITHTFFPNFSTREWTRADARYRDRSNPDEYLEMLCDIGAAELLFPSPWFPTDAACVTDSGGLVRLASTYRASREATIRRFAEISPESIAAVYFVWKLKPTQKGTVGRKQQVNLFGITPEEELAAALRLRIEYAIPSPTFKSQGHFLPVDKSIESDGPVFQAAVTGKPADGDCFLDLGQAAGTYRVSAVPLWAPSDQLGPNGENAVAAIIRPLSVPKQRRRAKQNTGPTLFDDP